MNEELSRRLRSSFFALVLLAVTTRLFALDVPPKPTNWFTDDAHVVNASDADALNARLKSFEEQSGVRFIVYIFPTLGGEAPEDYTIRCAEKWTIWRTKDDK